MQGFPILLFFVDGVHKEYSGERTRYITDPTPAFSSLCHLPLYRSVVGDLFSLCVSRTTVCKIDL